jgi:DNA-binding winged helix-turn-helix (wHTH) protein
MSAQRSVCSDKQAEVISLLHALQRRHKLLLGRISRAEELAGAIELDIEQLLGQVEAGTLAPADVNGAVNGTRKSQEVKHALRQTAPGAFSVELHSRADGSVVVCIDDGKEFTLPATLADLLAILCEDSARSPDEFIGWKSIDDVVNLLKEKTGRRPTKRAVTQSVYRLRQELLKVGVNPYLVQTNRRSGLRFALRRKSELVDKKDDR